MGCGGSKAVRVMSSNGDSFSNREGSTVTQEVEVNVFDNSENNNTLGGSSYNAKPRLRSAIRRGNENDIRPVISNTNDTEDRQTNIKPPRLHLTDHSFESESHINRDSGFDSNRDNSVASDRAKSVTKEDKSGRLSNSSYLTMRPESAMTSSVVTARDLNASFMTTTDDYMSHVNGDLTFDFDAPLEEPTDFEDSQSHILSNTPSRMSISVEPRPISVYPKNIEVIKEESEGGFTPRSIFNNDEFVPHTIEKEETTKFPSQEKQTCTAEELPKYPPDEVMRHNRKVGWSEWGIYKGFVYDANKVIRVFSYIYDEQAKLKNERIKEKHTEKNGRRLSDDCESDYDEYSQEEASVQSFDKTYPKRIINPIHSLGRAIKILLSSGIDMNTIQQELSLCLIGEVQNTFSTHYWDEYRKDVNKILDDLIRADLKDELSQNIRDLMEQLQRWVLKYGQQYPQPPPQQAVDLNIKDFTLPDGIQDHPECLRRWVETWIQFDLEISESGAWPTYEIEEIDLGDPHEIFFSTLRSHFDLNNPFIFDVEGEAAWEVLQPGTVADDIMTEGQKRTEEMRRNRTDLHDPYRMDRRRKRLLKYFVRKYEMDESKIQHFLQWAQSMEDGDRKFQNICEMG